MTAIAYDCDNHGRASARLVDAVRTLPVITAGEPEPGAWCAVCVEPWRLRIPLFADGELATVLEICPGCGTGHDKSAAYTVPVTEGPQPEVVTPRLPLPYRLIAALRERLMKPGTAPECAYGTCCRRTRAATGYALPIDEGTVRYYFCRAAHRRAWAAENGLPD